MNSPQEDLYELHWNNHAKVLKGTFDSFRSDNELVDVTLSCEGKKLSAHKIVLSACSLYFLDLFRDNPCRHPIIILRDIKYEAMVDILSFMYIGEVNVATEHLNTFLQTAEFLQVKGLSIDLPQGYNSTETESMNNLQRKHLSQSNQITLLEIDKNSVKLDTNTSVESVKTNGENDENNCRNNVSANYSSNQNDSLNNSEAETSTIINYNESLLNDYSDAMKSSEEPQENISSSLSEFFLKKGLQKLSSQEESEELKSNKKPIPSDILKTECIDMEDLTDDSIEFIGTEQTTDQNQDFPNSFSMMDFSGSPSTSSRTSNKLFPCPHCKKVFNHQISLKLHLPRHAGVTSCVICHSVLSRKYDLKVHMRRKHNIDMNEFFKSSGNQRDQTSHI